jgi:hypothetical protein
VRGCFLAKLLTTNNISSRNGTILNELILSNGYVKRGLSNLMHHRRSQSRFCQGVQFSREPQFKPQTGFRLRLESSGFERYLEKKSVPDFYGDKTTLNLSTLSFRLAHAHLGN